TGTFMGNAGATVGKINDPVVEYNEFAGRWVMGCSCATDYLFVSATADATGSWSAHPLAGLSGDLTLRLGHDKNGEYVSEYQAGGSDSNTANFAYELFAIPTTELMYSGSFVPAHINAKQNGPYEAIPATDHDPMKTATAPA